MADEQSSMLTEDEKSRIRAEEIFRSEVRCELEARKASPPQQRLWTLLNSSFALWFLSSVVLAGLTTAVTFYQSKRGEHLRRAEAVRHLDTEISSRIGLAQRVVRLQQSSLAPGYGPLSAGDIYGTAVDYLDNSFATRPADPQDFSIYPEYKSRTFRSLIFELTTVADPSERLGLNNAVVTYEKLRDIETQLDGKEKATPQTAESVIRLLDQLTMPRWRVGQTAQ
jgi:hypothetical protein